MSAEDITVTVVGVLGLLFMLWFGLVSKWTDDRNNKSSS